MRGTSESAVGSLFALVLAVLTIALIYAILPRSTCDTLAQQSVIEMKAAIECAANKGIDARTGEACSQTAVVKLCQEPTFFSDVFGAQQIGLLSPQYVVLYESLSSSDPITSLAGRFQFNEHYPFTRAGSGSRFYDIAPTTTKFKEWYKTKYLLEPCDNNALCFSIRGREEVIKLYGLPSAVRLVRQGSIIPPAAEDPYFYLVSPCFAKVTFFKGDTAKVITGSGGRFSDQDIYGYVNRCGQDIATYCYADENLLRGYAAIYAGETACEIVTFLKGGPAGNIAKQSSKLKKAGKLVEYGLERSFSGPGGMFRSLKPRSIKTASGGRKLSVSGDFCRTAAGLAESAAWPGFPINTLKDYEFARGAGDCKNTAYATEILGECCATQYSLTTPLSQIVCDEPPEEAAIVKLDVKKGRGDNLTLEDLRVYLGASESQIRDVCANEESEYFRVCDDGEPGCSGSEHTFSWSPDITAEHNIFAATLIKTPACSSNVTFEFSQDDGGTWTGLGIFNVSRSADSVTEDGSVKQKFIGAKTFNKFRMKEGGDCLLDSSAVIIDVTT